MSVSILIADDEALERRAIRKILEAEPGIDILEAENGAEALRMVGENQVALVLLDIKMPGLDGIAVAERLRTVHPDVGVVFLTAYDQFDYARSALRLHVDDFLLKPASSEEVVGAVRGLLARARNREGDRESNRLAMARLESAIRLVTERLRRDLSEGIPDAEQVGKFLSLRNLEGRPFALLECRPVQPSSSLGHVAKWAESWFESDKTVALAALQNQTLRVLRMGLDQTPDTEGQSDLRLVLLKQFREAVRSAFGTSLLIGAARSDCPEKPDELVTAAHRAASLATAANPVILVTLGAEGDVPGWMPNTPSLPSAVAKVLSLMENRMAEDLSLNEVAAGVSLSPSHLSRQLARATGRGFAEWLAMFRIAAAKRYLGDPSLSIKEVAHLVGFHDPAYFARVFRRLEGKSPADFRTDGDRAAGAGLAAGGDRAAGDMPV